MPNSQVSRPQAATGVHLLGGLGILVVTLGANVSEEDDLANLLSVLGDIDEDLLGLLGMFRGVGSSSGGSGFDFFVRLGLDDAGGEGGDEAVTLAGELRELLLGGEGFPFGEGVGDR